MEYISRRGKSLNPLSILTHDHPDPDALASAWSLSRLAEGLCGVRARIVYGGVIARTENRMMMERLRLPAQPVRGGEPPRFDHVALVDTQPAFKNNRFPAGKNPDIVIDHHPRDGGTRARFAWIDRRVGATTTLMAQALVASGLSVSRRLATAIIYGIGSETQNLGREATAVDLEAYQTFWPKASIKTLWNISYPKRSRFFFADLTRALTGAFICRNVIGSHLGDLRSPERVAQIADFLLTHEKAGWSIVTGRYKGKLYVSLRTTDSRGGAGTLLKRLLGGKNRGGGHSQIAGGALDVGLGASPEKWIEAERGLADSFLESRGIKHPEQKSYPYRHV